MQIRDHVALVTGGASGLGEACVRQLVAAGAKVAFLDVNNATGKALANELGENAQFFKADVAVESEVFNAINDVVRHFGTVHIVLNCAGIAPSEKVLTENGVMQLRHFERVMQVNLIGTFNIIRLVAAIMARNTPNAGGERGVIVNASSVAAFDGQIGQAAYAASKSGVSAMTLPLAREFAPLGIRVMSIAPGIFDTPLLEAMPEAVRDELGKQAPFPARLGRPSEYAHLAQAVIENEMLNGETIRLDGAMRAGLG